MKETQYLSRPPFEHSMRAKEFNTSPVTELLPATFRTKQKHIDTPGSDIEGFLSEELLVEKLDRIENWLWASGRPVPPRSLHRQVQLRRSLTITEKPELHLVWNKDRIFIKPVPRFLLDSEFWKTYICTPLAEGALTSHAPSCSSSSHGSASGSCSDLEKAARGLLFSYVALIAYRSDFDIAEEAGLIYDVSWKEWKKIAQDVTRNHTYNHISPRYRYGELRLTNLNRIYRFVKGEIVWGFSTVDSHSHYAGFFTDNLGKVIAFSGYVVVVLTAMQVGLATKQLQPSDAFQRASYGFTVFSITAPICGGIFILLVFLYRFAADWVEMLQEHKIRVKKTKEWDMNNRCPSGESQD